MIKIHNKCLARAINIQLSFKGINKYFDDFIYTEEEILKITNINLINPNSLDEIDSLISLEVLNVGYSNCFNIEDYITNFDIISKLTNLKSFTLLNDIAVKTLDLSNLVHLEKLKIIYNPNLEEIIGLDKLTSLRDIMIVGNNIKEINNFLSIIKNNSEINNFTLDIYIYPILSKYLNNYLDKIVTFAEKISFGEIYKTDSLTMNIVHNKAVNIINNINKENIENAIINIYKYIVTHLTYDYDTLEERNNYYINHKYNPLSEDEIMNKFRAINTCIHSLLNGCGVCEAYVNALIYLYNLIDIKSRSLRVKEKGSNNHYDHAAMCFIYKSTIYYSDPQKENDFIKLNKLFMSEEEFNEIYDISPLDKLIIEIWKEELNDKITRDFKRTK